MKTTAAILLASLLVGFTANQLREEGISWRFLKPVANNGDIRFVTADSAYLLLLNNDCRFIDVRVQEEFELDHLPDALSLPVRTFYSSPESIDSLDPSTTYITYCFEPECRDSEWIAGELQAAGFVQVMVLKGGFSGWLEFGFPGEN